MKSTRRLPGLTFLFLALALGAQTLLPGMGSPERKAHAQATAQPAAQAQASTPLGQMLNADGALNLNTGFNGSLDPSGYDMQAGPDGEPRFVPAVSKGPGLEGGEKPTGPTPDAPGDSSWQSGYGFKGLNGEVFAMTPYRGDLIVGGSFTATKDGSVSLKHIARWDGSEAKWYPLGSGLNSTVKSLLWSGPTIYAGGLFTKSGDNTQTLNHIAKWVGGTWQPMAYGLGDWGTTYEEVRVMVADGNYIYAAGSFKEVCTPLCYNVNNIARWNPAVQMWDPVDNGVNTQTGIFDMAMSSSGILYIGGAFSQAGNWPVHDIAELVGGHWYPFGDPDGLVYAIALSGNDIYIGGSMASPGPGPECCVAKWNHSTQQWDPLMDGIQLAMTDVEDIEVIAPDEIYVGGYNDADEPKILRWDGSSWHHMGSTDGLTGCITQFAGTRVRSMAHNGNQLFVGGCFDNVAGQTEDVDNIAMWRTDESKWEGLSGGINGVVNAILVRGTDIYVAGAFSMAGGLPANNVARWNGASWSSFGQGVGGQVNALALSPDGVKLYAGGGFTTASGSTTTITANHIAVWDQGCAGSACGWQSLGTGNQNGLNNTVGSIVADSSNVYVGGFFTLAGTYNASRVARWSLSGNRWYPLGGALNDNVYDLALNGTDLYIGGKFTQVQIGINTLIANHIVRWTTDSQNWYSLGTGTANGVSSDVTAIAISGSNVYVGGGFTHAGGISADHIARWNGTSWSALGGGLESMVKTIAIVGTKVYAGGVFSTRTAMWNGSTWSPLGSGIPDGWTVANSMSANPTTGDLYVGGLFTVAGAKPSRNIGLYHGGP